MCYSRCHNAYYFSLKKLNYIDEWNRIDDQ